MINQIYMIEQPCKHDYTNPVMVINKTQVHAGSAEEAEAFCLSRVDKKDVVLVKLDNQPIRALAKISISSLNQRHDKALSRLHYYTTNRLLAPVAISIPWPDFDVPALEPRFWEDMVLTIQGLRDQKVFVHCAHGHGRTGTFLSIIAAKAKVCNPVRCIKWIRTHHCKRAVESVEQIRYIEQVVGVTLNDGVPERETPKSHGLKAWWDEPTPSSTKNGEADSFLELYNKAKKAYLKSKSLPEGEKSDWDDKHLYYAEGEGYTSSWGGKFGTDWGKASALQAQVLKAVERWAKEDYDGDTNQ
jgi:protein-tyrosine phosphatase